MKTDFFHSCGHCWVFQICWHIECSTFTASSFRIWNSSTGSGLRIPSPCNTYKLNKSNKVKAVLGPVWFLAPAQCQSWSLPSHFFWLEAASPNQNFGIQYQVSLMLCLLYCWVIKTRILPWLLSLSSHRRKLNITICSSVWTGDLLSSCHSFFQSLELGSWITA